jgi:AcrR family transcriptional regulator
MTRLRRRRDPQVAARRAQKRDELLAAAIRAIRAEGPSVSMKEMAAEAGVTKPILYRHFGAKGGLYQAIAERYANQLLAQIRSALSRDVPSQDLLEATLDTHLSFLEQETEVHRFLVQRALHERLGPGQALLTGFREQIAVELEKVLRDRVAPSGTEEAATVWAHALVGMAEFAGEWWMAQDHLPRERLVRHLSTLLWNGFSGLVEGGTRRSELPGDRRRPRTKDATPAALPRQEARR